MKLELDLTPAVYAELCAIAQQMGVPQASEMALIAIMQWTAARKAELDNLDPGQRYFVNEALDELLERQNKLR